MVAESDTTKGAERIGEMPEGRPIYRFQRDFEERIADAISALALVGGFGVIFWFWSQIPDRAAIHFNWRGEPDGWGSKYLLLLIPFIAAALVLFLGVIRRVPHRFNYLRPITEANALRCYRIARATIAWIQCEASALLFILTLFVVFVNIGVWQTLPSGGLLIIVLLMIATAVYKALQSYAAGRTDEAAHTAPERRDSPDPASIRSRSDPE